MPETFCVEGHKFILSPCELHDVAVRFQAAVGDHRDAVGPFDDRVGFLEGFIRIAA